MLRNISGIIVLLLIAIIFSSNRKKINKRTVIGAFLLQLSMAFFVLVSPTGRKILLFLSNKIQEIINYSGEGIKFMFGDLGSFKMGFIFAINVLPVIVFMSSLISVLYYLGIMQRVTYYLGGAVKKLLKTSDIESTAATANIFIGNTDVFMLMKPYLSKMTESELFALMVGGFASVAGSVLVGYAGMGVELKYLIAASFMSAPGGLLMAKLIMPETEKFTKVDLRTIKLEDEPINIIEAATNGAASGVNLAMYIGGMMIALIALIAMLNGMLGGIGSWFGNDSISIQLIFSYIFAPIAWLLGVPSGEVMKVASLIGQKLVLNEFVAYTDLMKIKSSLSLNSQVIATFALAGFANLSAPAAILGVLGNLIPEKKSFLAKVSLKVILAAMLSNLMSAAIANLLINFL